MTLQITGMGANLMELEFVFIPYPQNPSCIGPP